MIKREIYYKFIFTNYDSLSVSDDSDFVLDSDGVDQKGEVRALCNACPERVITYDQLSATDSAVLPMYSAKWLSADRARIKSYIDQWVSLPKYFNLRNYNDQDPSQILGMSLMVSHSPEVGIESTTWTKFTGYDSKTVYCSLIVSSGDFFYNFCLPDEALTKSNLRDSIVANRFHGNWYFTQSEKDSFIRNVDVGQGKRVFCQHYFNESFSYGWQNTNFYYVTYTDTSGNRYLRSDENLHCRDIYGSTIAADSGYPYTGSFKNFPPAELIRDYFVTINGEDIPVTMKAYQPDEVTDISDKYYLKDDTSIEVSPVRTVEKYEHLREDLKLDFLDLEVTRRVLFYYDGTHLKYGDLIRDIHPTRDIPRIEGGDGFNTLLSYQPPDEYVDADYTYSGNSVRGTPPLQIPYNLLRYCLNDRPPFTDCETVLVMWVADRDPNTVPFGDVAELNRLNWQQYAIPISVRCRYKDGYNPKHCNDRFLVQYPYRQDSADQPKSHRNYGYHFRCNEVYNDTNKFDDKRALFLKDLVNYSEEYIISYQSTDYITRSNVFDAQKYLFTKFGKCDALYIKKKYMEISATLQPLSYRRHISQVYYLHVPDDLYYVNPSRSDDYLRDNSDHSQKFIPSVAPYTSSKKYFRKENFEDWNFLYDNGWGTTDNVCAVNDKWRIALFKFDPEKVSIETGSLQIVNDESLYSLLGGWGDIYISSFGITNHNPHENDSYIYNIVSKDDTYAYPIGFLDNYIQIDDTTYGRTSNNKVVVGFKLMYDYKYEDLYHFKYNTTAKKYEPKTVQYDFASGQLVKTQSNYKCTAYVMNYS